MSVTSINLDYESAGDVQLVGPRSVGLHNYANDLSTRVLMAAYCWNMDGRIEHRDFTKGERLPPEVIDAIKDPHVIKYAFNAQFERVMTRDCLGIDTPYEGWRCTMVEGYMKSFVGGLGEIGKQIGLSADALKDADGKRLLRMFSGPQRITRNQPLLWRTRESDPADWQKLCDYNVQDVAAEIAQLQWLQRYPSPDFEWELYEIDQRINDRGLPVNTRFVENAIKLVARRKQELMGLLSEVTGLANPNSGAQLIPWLLERGYPFHDLQKDTVKKVLSENKAGQFLAGDAVAALKLRQQASRTSVKKYDAILQRLDSTGHLRHCFQFAGASRTNRWAGRGPQPHNLVRTPGILKGHGDDWGKLSATAEAIEEGDYDFLQLMCEEPMTLLAGSIRSAFQAKDGEELLVNDLSAIESAVTGWLAQCPRILKVFADGLDPYKDFGTGLYQKPYAAITSEERNICKPPTLGCCYGLGGGREIEGKRTGLWGYAEGMGVSITQEEAARQVKLYRAMYPEVPNFWSKLEDAAKRALRGETIRVNGLLTVRMLGKMLVIDLPSGRPMYYYKPRMEKREFPSFNGSTYTRQVFTAMGMSQKTKQWGRILFGGPKFCENTVQATARDILGVGVHRSHTFGFNLRGTVHDEIITPQKPKDPRYTLAALGKCMVAPIEWAKGLPLKSAGYSAVIYRKD